MSCSGPKHFHLHMGVALSWDSVGLGKKVLSAKGCLLLAGLMTCLDTTETRAPKAFCSSSMLRKIVHLSLRFIAVSDSVIESLFGMVAFRRGRCLLLAGLITCLDT